MRRQIEAFTDGTFDVCIVGGGITGAGVALDAATRGWRVALIDKGDFASGASSASSKLIHGGLRYLEYGHLPLVHEALVERGRLLRHAPHLVEPLPFFIPFLASQRIAPWQWRLGMTVYDLLAGRANIARSRPVALREVRAALPALRDRACRGGAVYYDALMDDARLCLAVLQTAAEHGAVLANYVEAVGFEKPQGTIDSVVAHDRLSGRRFPIRARAFVNAAGPFADAVCSLAGEAVGAQLQPTKGVHLIAPAREHRMAALLLHPRDGRVFFVIPWFGKILVGTTDTIPEPGAGTLNVQPDEIEYLLEGYNHHFDPGLGAGDVMGSFAGLRPLLRAQAGAPSARSREFRLQISASGLITALGGKYTTFRQMAETITDVVGTRLGSSHRCRTHSLCIAGAPATPWPEFFEQTTAAIAQRHPLCPDSAAHLVRRYGDRVEQVLLALGRTPRGFDRVHPDEPDVMGEQTWQRDEEMAIFREDFLLRRSRIGMWRPELLAST
jgi:glycerol-3-phosphate dehydrogenase